MVFSERSERSSISFNNDMTARVFAESISSLLSVRIDLRRDFLTSSSHALQLSPDSPVLLSRSLSRICVRVRLRQAHTFKDSHNLTKDTVLLSTTESEPAEHICEVIGKIVIIILFGSLWIHSFFISLVILGDKRRVIASYEGEMNPVINLLGNKHYLAASSGAKPT